MNSTSEDKNPSAGVYVSSGNPQNLIFLWEEWNTSLMGILWYVTRIKHITLFVTSYPAIYSVCKNVMVLVPQPSCPLLTQIGPNPRGVLAGHTVLIFIHTWGVWRSLDSLVRQHKVLRNFMWSSTLSLLWCGEKEAPAFSVAQFSPVLSYTLHQIWKKCLWFWTMN